VRALLFLGIGK